jgi:hypothetical protein
MIGLDADNAVVRLCLAGIRAEQAGDGEAAAACYARAWEASTGPAEACVAAHYLARVQLHADSKLQWNARALELAGAAGDLDAFMPSLELNLGSAHEELGNHVEAARHYRAAASALDRLGADPTSDSLRAPIARALQRAELHRSNPP